ncbi:MAG: lysophospholipid acyltransferase family protein [Leucothrix sp.]
MIRKVFKIFQLLMHIFYGIGVIIYHTLIKRRDAHDPIFKEAFTHWYKQGCDIVGLRIVVEGKPADGPVLMVANHVSWLDILLLASVANPRFLSKAEIRKWPLIGWAGQQIDTLFIQRGERSASEAASAGIAEGLQQGNRILIFPEGTTTEGKVVKRLHARLFGAAINTRSPVQPIVIHYTDNNAAEHTSDRIHYVGQQNLITNLWLLLGCKNPTAYVYCLPTVDSEGLTRRELSNKIHQTMRQSLERSQQAQLARATQA